MAGTLSRIVLTAGVLVTGIALGQTAQVTGTVTDPSGAVIANARVLVTNTETSVARESVSNERGHYLVTALLPGRYEVTAEVPGFRQVKRGPVTLAIDQIARVDFAMEVGA